MFEQIKEASPGEEIALLRISIRRMLGLVMEAGSLKEMFQTMNALGYIAGRLAKLFEVQITLDRQAESEDENREFLLVLEMVVERVKGVKQR